ncbi:GNAT family N-acetyltransferase [Ectobacillus sp. sgz5001026]|uniref:GNAT family N-acetyltransferase n=1 Tax=Ectobacillus sp. sgz5001026 TaxID=3242473 RepID=UPI0036D23C5B
MEITKVQLSDAKKIMGIYKAVVKELRANEIYQWDRFYPNSFVIREDIKNGYVYGIKEESTYVGVIVLNTNQSAKYKQITWNEMEGTPLVIHRLAVHPGHQGKGIGRQLMQFALQFAREHGHLSIRLDVYTKNPHAVTMYERAGFEKRGQIKFPFRNDPYICMEKSLFS